MNYRQGDVLISKTKKIQGKKKKDLILAYGEVTGHRHELICDKDGASLYEENGVLYLHIEAKEATLYHGTTDQIRRQCGNEVLDYQKEDCHEPITLPNGDYEIKIQREYIPNGWKNVVD